MAKKEKDIPMPMQLGSVKKTAGWCSRSLRKF